MMPNRGAALSIPDRLLRLSFTRDESVAKAEATLLGAGLAFLSRNPAASLAEVAEVAGVGRATLYRYFSSRANLVRGL